MRDDASPRLRSHPPRAARRTGRARRAARAPDGAGSRRTIRWPTCPSRCATAATSSRCARGARRVVGGIVHDASSTGATLFVEPPAAVEFGNRIRELEADEQKRGAAHPRGAHRGAAPAARADARRARRAGRPRLAVRARAFAARVRVQPVRPRARPATASRSTPAAIRCCSRRACRSCRSTSRWTATSTRCWCRGPTRAARRCCSRRSR